jgi:hypothetical protein
MGAQRAIVPERGIVALVSTLGVSFLPFCFGPSPGRSGCQRCSPLFNSRWHPGQGLATPPDNRGGQGGAGKESKRAPPCWPNRGSSPKCAPWSNSPVPNGERGSGPL